MYVYINFRIAPCNGLNTFNAIANGENTLKSARSCLKHALRARKRAAKRKCPQNETQGKSLR